MVLAPETLLELLDHRLHLLHRAHTVVAPTLLLDPRFLNRLEESRHVTGEHQTVAQDLIQRTGQPNKRKDFR